MDFDPSDFGCVDEHIEPQYEEGDDYFLEQMIEDSMELDLSEIHHDVWDDFDQINPDDIPW